MIDTSTVRKQVNRYREYCRRNNRKPTYKGLGTVLGISTATVSNVIHGHFNGMAYTNKPAVTRCIDNPDFEVIQGLFEVARTPMG